MIGFLRKLFGPDERLLELRMKRSKMLSSLEEAEKAENSERKRKFDEYMETVFNAYVEDYITSGSRSGIEFLFLNKDANSYVGSMSTEERTDFISRLDKRYKFYKGLTTLSFDPPSRCYRLSACLSDWWGD